MNLLITICGRAGSKGVKNKNVRDFLGHPLPYYTLSAVKLYLKDHRTKWDKVNIVLNTDSKELIALVEKAPLDVDIIVRDVSLAGDFVGKVDVIRNCLVQMEDKYQCTYDVTLDLDITSPLRTVQDIDNTLTKKLNTATDLVYTVTEARRNPYFNQVTRKGEYYSKVLDSDFVSRQQAPKIYDMNASIYAYDREYLAHSSENKTPLCDIVEMMDTGILDIDSEADFELMGVIAEYLFNQYNDMREITNNLRCFSNK
ncbi:acylneuraminate cytidylyltransferase family protein [Oscillospiraceae bacterium PP1C4]